MQQYTIRNRINSDASQEEVIDAAKFVLNDLGGEILSGPSGLNVINGKIGLTLAQGADLKAEVRFREVNGKHEVQTRITKQVNKAFWMCLGFGLLLAPLWIINVMYFFTNPVPAYQAKLSDIEFELR